MEDYVIEFAKKILAIDSPTGYCKDVIEFVNEEVKKLGYQTSMNNKGNLFIHVKGKSDKTIGLCAHVDTLGLMVRSIKENGDLAFTNIGGPIIPTLDGEYCRVITRDKKVYTGTILSDYPAAHVYEKSKTAIRKCENMHIRLDEIVSKFIELAKSNNLNYAIDIYPFYGSDVSAALRGGNDIKGGLIGPGVHASHGMERSHKMAIDNTIKLILAYLQD